MENNACSEEGDLDIETEPRRDGFQELCLVLKFGFFSFVRFDAKGWVLRRWSKCSSHTEHSQAEKLRNLDMTHHQVRTPETQTMAPN
jgi:hypothetical protein